MDHKRWYMKGKEMLCEIKKMDIYIKQRQEELRELREKINSVAAVNTEREKVKGGKGKGYELVDKCMDMEREILRIIGEYEQKKHIVIDRIQGMDNIFYGELLFKRYVEFKSLENIAEDMNYSYNYIRRVHGEAVEKFGELIDGK